MTKKESIKKESIKKESKNKKSRYNNVITETRTFNNSVEKTMQITRSNNKQIDVNEMESLFKGIQKNKKGSKFIVRALNGQRWFTFKGYEDSELNIMDFEEYYENKVKDSQKFEMFSQIEIISLSKVEKLKN